MDTRDATEFEIVLERSALWSRLGSITTAVVAGLFGLLFAIGAVAGVVELVSPPTQRAPSFSREATLVAAGIALWLLRSSVRAGASLLRGTREIVGVIEHAKQLTHSGQRASYRLWHVVIDGQEYTFAPSELRGSGAHRLRPGQRASVRVVGDREVVRLSVARLSVARGAAYRKSPSLAPPRGEPAPLSSEDIGRVRAWAVRRAAVFALFALGLGGIVASKGGPLTVLHALFALLIGGLAWGLADATRTLLVARSLVAGKSTRYVEGSLRQDDGMLRDTFLDGQRIADAAQPGAPRLATKARARVVALPVPDRGQPELLVAVEWVDATD